MLRVIESVKETRTMKAQLSVAVAIPVDAGDVSAIRAIIVSAGQMRSGGVVSSIKIVCTQLPTLPHSSTAVWVRTTNCVQIPGTGG